MVPAVCAAVASALSGDTIDLRGLACRRINLTSGAIMIPQDDLTLVGGGRITVDANRLSSVFRHTGTGWLRVRGMTIARGLHRSGTEANGGCLYSAGNIELAYVLVHWCHVRATGDGVLALGGGLYAAGAVALTNSRVEGNSTGHALPRQFFLRHGGGIYAGDRLTAHRSRIIGNRASRGGGAWSNHGGIDIRHTTISKNTGGALEAWQGGDSVIANSTISNNKGSYITLFFGNYEYTPDGSAMIINSTISGNQSGNHVLSNPVVWITRREKSIVNSTIAFNGRTVGCGVNSGAVRLRGGSAHIESSILAHSTCGGRPTYDLASSGGPRQIIEGANNLIMSANSSNVTVPSDTISLDPRLAPLASNGGRTRTHALLDDSPAIDMGNNAAGLAYDQRGQGFPRVKGLQADIGAYER